MPRDRRARLAIGGALALAIVAIVAGGLVVGGVLPPRAEGIGPALGPPRFVEEGAAAGIDHAYTGEFDFFVGGGVAAFDCDGDHRIDLYLAGGSAPAALYRNTSPTAGALRFEPVPGRATDLDRVTGAYPLDLDGDGVTDLAVLRHGETVLLRGLGACRFERANEALAFDGGDAWTTAFSASWETADQVIPTLAFGDYVETDANGNATFDCPDNRLIRPAADGSTYGPPIALAPGWCPLSMLFSDWDRSGRRDLRVSNDRHYYRDGQEQLWRVAAGEAPRLYTDADGWKRLRIWGMGIASDDLTGDGLPEVYLTSQGDNKLQALADGPTRPTYEDIALEMGVTAHRPSTGDDLLPSTAWHPAFEDVNDDGYTDLFVSKGNVEGEVTQAMSDPSDLFLGGPDGRFTQAGVESGIAGDVAKARGAALIDLNADGLLDLVKVVRREPVQLWRNVGTGDAGTPVAMGHWLGVEITQDGPNPDGIGAWVAVRVGEHVAERERTVGGGHVSGQLGPVHVGLGSATAAEVRVTWPDGEVGPWQPVGADRVVRIVRGASAPEVIGP